MYLTQKNTIMISRRIPLASSSIKTSFKYAHASILMECYLLFPKK